MYEQQLEQRKKEIDQSHEYTGSGNDEEMVAAISKDFDQNNEEVIEMLIRNVMNVNIDIPRVVKGNFEED